MDSSTHEIVLEDMIYDNQEFVQQRGFPVLYKNNFRQFPIGTFVCDIISYEMEGGLFKCKIFELKRGQLSVDALLQVIGYGEGIAKYAAWVFDKSLIELHVVGFDIDDKVLKLAAWGLNVNIVTFEYRYDGIHFESFDNAKDYPSPHWLANPSEHGKPTDDAIEQFKLKLFNSIS